MNYLLQLRGMDGVSIRREVFVADSFADVVMCVADEYGFEGVGEMKITMTDEDADDDISNYGDQNG